MSEWKTIPADVFCDSVRDGTHDTPKQVENGYKLVTAKHINNGQIDLSDAYLISESDYLKINERSKVEQWDVLMSMIGNGLGKSAVVKDNPQYAIKNLALFKLGNEIKAKWLHYYLSSQAGQGFIYNSLQGSGQPFISLSLLRKFPIPIPDDEKTMCDIVAILSRYDTLIENYQKQIKLLEEAAQRLYKEWFVELRFPGHENTKMVDGLPEGWERKKLGELVTKSIGGGWGKESPQEKYDKEGFVIRGTDISKLRCGNLDDIPFRYHTESNLKERTLSDGDLIFEVSGGSEKEPVGRMYLITQQILDFYKKDVICASFCKKAAFSNKCTSILCYFAMQYCRISGDMKKFEKDSAGNIINFAWTSFLEDFFVLLPNDEILEAFYKTAIDIINKQVNLALQIRLLTEARDRLLPRLMGGEMEV